MKREIKREAKRKIEDLLSILEKKKNVTKAELMNYFDMSLAGVESIIRKARKMKHDIIWTQEGLCLAHKSSPEDNIKWMQSLCRNQNALSMISSVQGKESAKKVLNSKWYSKLQKEKQEKIKAEYITMINHQQRIELEKELMIEDDKKEASHGKNQN